MLRPPSSMFHRLTVVPDASALEVDSTDLHDFFMGSSSSALNGGDPLATCVTPGTHSVCFIGLWCIILTSLERPMQVQESVRTPLMRLLYLEEQGFQKRQQTHASLMTPTAATPLATAVSPLEKPLATLATTSSTMTISHLTSLHARFLSKKYYSTQHILCQS